jgi:hypothetical protein
MPVRMVVRKVLDSHLSFATDTEERTGTSMVFDITQADGKTEVRFTHVGLDPEVERFEACPNGWGFSINGSLQDLISTGRGAPAVNED